MALVDFLGDTSEIKIIDFLADNMDQSYNQTEISEYTGLSRTTVNKKIPELIQNELVTVDKAVGKFKTFRLADNEIVKLLVASSLTHSFRQAKNPLSDEEQRELITRKLGKHMQIESSTEDDRNLIIPIPSSGSLILTRDAAEKISEVLDKKLGQKRKRSPID